MSAHGIFSPRRGTEEIGLAASQPIIGIPRDRRHLFVIYVVAVALLLLPSVWDDDAGIDALANAMSYAALALGLNVVVGFAGLLDLGYAAFFAIGAYFYGILTSFQIMPEWSGFWVPFAAVGLVEKLNQGGPDLVHFTLSFWLALAAGGGGVGAVRHLRSGRRPLRLRGDYLAIVTLGFGEIVPIVARKRDVGDERGGRVERRSSRRICSGIISASTRYLITMWGSG